jgi:hypothetical protein
MKKILRCVALVGILGVTAWSANDRPALASDYCEAVHGTPCSPRRSTRTCINSDGSPGSCICSSTGWICTL